MSLAQVMFGLVVIVAILLIVAIVIGLMALNSIRANKEETERLRGESVTGVQLATVVEERVSDAVEQVLHYYGLDQQALDRPPLRLGLTATPYNGDANYLQHMQHWRDGGDEGKDSWNGPQVSPPGDGTYNGHSGELPTVGEQLPADRVIDHAGARVQLAERAGRPPVGTPAALQGYEEVRPEPPHQYQPLGTQGPTVPGEFYWTRPARPGDTDVIDAIREPDTPPEFHDREFQRRPDETEDAYDARIAELTRSYTAWLDAQRLDVTGQIPAITSVPHGAGHNLAEVQGAGTSAK